MAEEIFRNFLHIKSLQDLNYSKINEKNIFVKKEKDFDINLPKFLYKEIGKDYYWKDRLVWSDKNWSDYVSQAGYQLHTLYKDKNLVGYYEVLSDNYLNFEIAYFGNFVIWQICFANIFMQNSSIRLIRNDSKRQFCQIILAF